MRGTNRRPVVRRILAPAAGVVAAGGGAVLLGSAVWIRLASAGRVVDENEAPHRPVAMVLGAEAYPDGRPSPMLAARLDLGARLLRSGRADSLLLTGAGHTPGLGETETMRAYLVARGIDPALLETDPHGVDTRASCRGARDRGHTSLLVVSQAFHLPRIVALARVAGLDAVGVGDTTAKRWQGEWLRGEVREVFAGAKAAAESLVDVLRSR